MSVNRAISSVVHRVPNYIIAAVVAMLVLSAIGTYMILNPAVPAVSIPTAKVGRGTIYPFVSLTGQVGNHQAVDISSSTGGQIVHWLVQEGSVVKANEPLAYFSNYQLNQQIYDNLKVKLQDLITVENDQLKINELNVQNSAPLSTIKQDMAAKSQAQAQYNAAQKMASDAYRQYLMSQTVPLNQKQSYKTAVDKANTTVAIDNSLLNQAKVKLQTDQNVIQDNVTIKADQQAVIVAIDQLDAAQSLATATQNQTSVVTQSDIQAAKSALDQTVSQVSIDQSLLNQAQTKLSSDELPQATSSVIGQDQANLNLLNQELTNAENQFSIDQNPPSSSSIVQSDQANINLLQTELSGAKNQLSVDQSAGASTSVIQSDQNTVNDIQQQLTDAKNKLSVDQAPEASVSQIQQDQANISDLKQQIAAAQNQLYNDQHQSAPNSVIQEDEAAVQVAQQQYNAAVSVENADQNVYNQAQNSVNQANLASLQTALAQANGNVQVDQALMNQAMEKLKADESSSQNSALIQQDQVAIDVTEQQLNADTKLLQDAKEAAKLNDRPSQVQMLNAKVNYDQALGTARIDKAALNAANVKLSADRSPLSQSGVLAQNQVFLQAKEAADQAQLDVLNAKHNLVHSEILAPVSGIVVSVDVPVGTRIYSAQTTCTIYPLHQVQQIVALADASQVDQIKKSERVSFNSPDFNGTGMGTVDFISPVPVNQSQGNTYQYPIYINVKKIPEGAASGMLVNCNVYTHPIPRVILVSSHAIFTKNGNLGVYEKTGTHQFKFHSVNILASDNENVEISGLHPGTVVSLKQP